MQGQDLDGSHGAEETEDRRRGAATPRWRRARLIASAGILIGGAWGGTMALFTDSASVTANVFDTGTVDISAAPATALLTSPAMAPGDKVTAPLTVSNLGTLELRYSMSGSLAAGSAALGAALTVDVRSGVADCSDAGFGLSGAAVASGTLSASSFGNPAAGAQAGDRVLAAGASEVLCFQVTLPITADDTLQATSAEGLFTLSAEQTRNNP